MSKILLTALKNKKDKPRDIILLSAKDSEIFFNALINPTGPNQALRDAAERYKNFIANA